MKTTTQLPLIKNAKQAFAPFRPVNRNKFWLVEKADYLALHGIFDSLASAERHLRDTIPDYCARGFFMDKTLRPESFEVIPGQY
jgi:hypothetical protein